jgi:AraC family transcriptional regulator of adaptative response/methylated-DNA-[protein]-cysteine methyltransferase
MMTLTDTLADAARQTEDDPRWARIQARDETADGQFWYAVTTTGIYCRPSCPSRMARPENVTIVDSPAAARSLGARPCKRCHPDGLSQNAENTALVAKACHLIEASHTPPSLAELAEATKLSPGYFHRMFKAATGLTPKGYAQSKRAERVRSQLKDGQSVTSAIYGAGFNSSGRFYESTQDMLGMTPSRYRDGGVSESLRFAVGQSSLGAILVASSAKGVAAILLGEDPDGLVRDLQRRFPKAELIGADANYEDLVARVVGLIEAPGVGLDLPLDVRGTSFQQRVWQALREIPAGATTTYAEIAKKIGSPQSTRAVAGACAANNLAVAIPCHRVIRLDGSLSGYHWGVERKRTLLRRESAEGATG